MRIVLNKADQVDHQELMRVSLHPFSVVFTVKCIVSVVYQRRQDLFILTYTGVPTKKVKGFVANDFIHK